MSPTGLYVFDRTLQTTHIWLNDICETVGPNEQVAWTVLSVVLHKLRDRLPVPVAAHLGAELPLLIRGAYYDQYQPENQPRTGNLDEFIAEVGQWLCDTKPIDPRDATAAVLKVLSHRLAPEQVAAVEDALPRRFAEFWDASVNRLQAAEWISPGFKAGRSAMSQQSFVVHRDPH